MLDRVEEDNELLSTHSWVKVISEKRNTCIVIDWVRDIRRGGTDSTMPGSRDTGMLAVIWYCRSSRQSADGDCWGVGM
jgi:hypothetical protein